ncbi:photosystem II stability/assembly factor-like uncharacterized protein [Halarchaeum rubridurum]|uniref:Photosystem II stability/assembly factor-like uncharacterized protein n=1 Tax=Halarchaeum rubridurum TaxID=489911 RepID=A0A830G303_9EURY|nr:hypothetical protein [Halarchaeum rubridurum]MBP1955566.1 photosystem II stability/assembly factor-like uncharacterized protein [Halarchaeum rubridurum]GGM73410.1 hypothetical protein GCM10009017_24150 [Halarchaeum rubridurum]
MGGTALTRRRVLGALGGVGAAALGVAATTGASADDEWNAVGSPTGNAINDVTHTSGMAHAVGSSGLVLRRVAGEWSIHTDEGAGRSKTLEACDTTRGGDRLWFCGASGTVGALDVESGEVTSHSKPIEAGNGFTDVAVAGSVGGERVYLASSSGTVVVGHHGKKGMTWTKRDTGASDTVTAVDFHTRERGHAVTNGSAVYRTTDGGATWEWVGIEDAQVPLKDVSSGARHVYVAGGAGRVFRLDCRCRRWTPFKAGSVTISAFERTADRLLGAGGSGNVVEPSDTGYTLYGTATGNHLNGVAIGEEYEPDVVVGDSGAILERRV